MDSSNDNVNSGRGGVFPPTMKMRNAFHCHFEQRPEAEEKSLCYGFRMLDPKGFLFGQRR